MIPSVFVMRPAHSTFHAGALEGRIPAQSRVLVARVNFASRASLPAESCPARYAAAYAATRSVECPAASAHGGERA